MTSLIETSDVKQSSGEPQQRLSLLTYLIFFFVPLVLLGTFSWYALHLEEGFRHSRAVMALEKEMETILHETDSLSIFPKWFKQINSGLFQKPEAPGEKKRNLQKLFPPGPLSFECYRFDALGNPIAPDDLSPSVRDEVSMLWKILVGTKFERRQMTLIYDRWLGSPFPLSLIIQRPGEVFYRATSKGRGLICIFREEPSTDLTGTIFLVGKEPAKVEILRSPFLKDLVPKFSRPTILVVKDTDGNVHRIRELEGRNADEIPVTYSGEFWQDPPLLNDFIRVIKRSGGEIFYALRCVPESDLSGLRYALIAIWSILGIFIILLFPMVSSQVSKRFFSIRWKIPILFAYSIVIPIAGSALLGHQTLRDRRDTMVSEVHRKALGALSELDSDFINEKSRELRLFRNFGQKVMRTADLVEIAGLAKTLQRQKEIVFAEVRDKYGRLLHTTWNADEKVRLSIVMDTISKVCLKRFHPNPPTQKGALDLTLGETFTQSFFLSPLVGWPKILERPDELHTITFAGRELFLYWAILPDSLNQAAFIQIQQNVSHLKHLYLRRRIEENTSFERGDFRFLAWNEQTREMVPRDQVFEGDIRGFLYRLRSSGGPLAEEIQIGETRFLASGFPGRHLGRQFLVALYPVSKIDTALRNFTICFFLGTMGVCLLALVFGFVLSDSFLRPIRDLSAGVHALRERDVSRRLNILSDDELGALAATFNQTLDGLKEMLLAHEVQSQLIPQVLPEIPGYQVALMSHPARDLGGDYCDLQTLSDGRICLVIGDATGHSVSSALVMTMAKAGVLDFIMRGISLTDLLKRLNLLFFTHFQRKVNMTFFAAVLDLRTGILQFSNAGHPFPILIDKDGNVSRLKLSHPPLGFSPRDDRFKEAMVTVEPGTLVFLFTDFLMEICDRKGIPWGSKNLIEFVRERRARKASEIRDDLFRFAKDYSGSDSFEDDFTLLILKRDNISHQLSRSNRAAGQSFVEESHPKG